MGHGWPDHEPPVVDDDEVWIGSSMAGNLNNSLFGSVDEIALYRRIVPAEVFATRYQRVEPERILPEPKPGALVLTLHPWNNRSKLPINPKPAIGQWQQSALGFVRLPRKYDDWGVREDWGEGVIVRAVSEIDLEPGDYEFLGRSRGIARLYVDGEQILTFPPARRGGGAHNQVQPVPAVPAKACVPAFWTTWRKSLSSRAQEENTLWSSASWWEVPSCALNSGKVVWPSQKKAECSACSDQIPAPN